MRVLRKFSGSKSKSKQPKTKQDFLEYYTSFMEEQMKNCELYQKLRKEGLNHHDALLGRCGIFDGKFSMRRYSENNLR